MAEATMLWIVPCADSPYKHILHILEQTSMDMIAEVLDCATTSILMVHNTGVSQPVPPVPWKSKSEKQPREGKRTYSRKNNWICEIRLLALGLCIHPH